MRPARNLQHSLLHNSTEVSRLFFKKALTSVIHPHKSVYLTFFSKFGSYSRRKSFCFFTKKPRSVFSKFRLSRIAFRELAMHGRIHGLFKASW